MELIGKYIDLIKEDITCDYLDIRHFQKKSNDYKINIICCEFKDENDLLKYWKKIIDNVAIYIQTDLEKIIELYNVYVIFFVENITKELLYIIEQDKYSSRKIVINSKMPSDKEELIDIVENRLFKFSIEENEENIMLDIILKEYNEEFYKFINKINIGKIDDIVLNRAIDILNN